LLFSDIKS